jgi:hypothetical protein
MWAFGAQNTRSSLQGQPDPGHAATAFAPAIPDRPATASRSAARARSAFATPPGAPWKDPDMATRPKPETTDDAREQARRALQTSMDTRQ